MRLGGAYAEILTDHHAIIRAALSAHDGREVDTAGDGFFAVFSSPRACINAAIDMQRGLSTHNWPKGERVRVRMGLHTGDATEVPVGFVGFDVHKAARIMAAANGGQVLVSEATATLVRDRLDAGVTLRDLGSHRLKDLSRSESLFQLEADGLETEFSPVRTLDNPALKHNLPVQLTTFVGRQAELDELSELVATDRLVTMVGPGGCGKTRLALQVGSALLDGSGAGVWFVDLAPLSDQSLVPSTVASVLQVKESPATPVTDALQGALADKRLLIILDNCEHVIDACAKLADGLLRTCGNVHILATSREPLGIDGEHLYPVAALAVTLSDAPDEAYRSDAVQLFFDRARTHDRAFTLDDTTLPLVVSICTQLDGIPLALELAAARLRSMSLAEIERRLEDRFRLITGGSRTALPRHQTLRATMDWSYESLNERDRAVFDRLSTFAGGFELDVAESVCAGDLAESYEVADAVASLVDKSLVLAAVGAQRFRYGLNETSRQYAAEHLATSPERLEGTRRAHSMAFLELAEQHAPRLLSEDQDEAIKRLETERDNLRAAIAYLRSCSGATAELLRFAVALGRFWIRTSTSREGLEVVTDALTRSDAADDPSLEVNALVTTVLLLIGAHEFSPANPYIERGLRLARELRDETMVAQLLASKVVIQGSLGDLESGLRTADEAVNAALRSGDDRVTTSAFNVRGTTRAMLADLDGAREDFTQAVSYGERAGDRGGLGRTLIGFGDLEMGAGNPEAARQHWERGLELADPHAKTSLRLLLSWLALLNEDIPRAAALILTNLSAIGGDHEYYGPFGLILAALCVSATDSPGPAAKLHGAGDTMVASATRMIWEEDGVTRLQQEDLARLRVALGNEFDPAYHAGLDWDEARRLAVQHLTPIATALPED